MPLYNPDVEDFSAPTSGDYSWDTARQDPELLHAVRSFYNNTEKKAFKDDNEAFDYMVSDRRWKDSNTWSALKEFDAVKGGIGIRDYKASEQDLKDLAVIRSRWEKLPGGIERMAKGAVNMDSGEFFGGAGAIAENVAKGFIDPTIVAGGIGGKAAGAMLGVGVKQGTKALIKTGVGIGLDAAISAGTNLAYQEANVDMGLQGEVDKFSVIAAGGLGAVLSAPGHITTHAPKKDLNINPKLLAEQALSQAAELKKKSPEINNLYGDTASAFRSRKKDLGELGDTVSSGVPDTSVEKSMLKEATKAAIKDPTKLEHTLASEFNLPLDKIEPAEKEIYDYISGRMLELNSTEDKIQLIRDTQGKFGDYLVGTNKRIGTNTVEDVHKAAAKGSANVDLNEAAQAIKDLPEGYGFNPVEMSFAHLVQSGLYKKYNELKAQLRVDPKNATLAREMRHALDVWSDITPTVKAGESQIGRGLNMLKYTTPSPDKLFGKAVEGFSKLANAAVGGESKFANQSDLMLSVADAIDMLDNDPLKIDFFLTNLKTQNATNLPDQLWEAWYNSLLSNPSTMSINAIGNTVTNALYLIERSSALTMNGKSPSKLLAGYFKAVPEAFKTAVKTFKTEIPWDESTRRELGGTGLIPSWKKAADPDGIMRWRRAAVGEEGSFGGKQIRAPGRFLMAMDDFNKMLMYRAHLTDVAATEGAAKGLVGKDLNKFIDDFSNAPPAAAHNQAKELGRTLTFTDDPGQVVRGMMQIIEDVPMARAFIPFVRTPANMVRYAASMTPMLGKFTKRTSEDLAAGGIRRTQAQARMAMGTGIMLMGAWGAYSGNVTSGGPVNPAEREKWMSSHLPWSVKAGNQWIQFNRVDPVAIPFAAGVAFMEAWKATNDDSRESAYWDTLASLFSDAVLDKTWFQGVQNIVQVTTDPERYGDSVMNGVVRTFVPSIVAGATRAYDPVVLAPKTFMEVIQDRMRFDRKELVPAKLDRYGREIPVEVLGASKDSTGILGFAARMISPIKTKTVETDPVALEMDNLKVVLSKPSTKYKGTELNSEQFYVYDKARSQIIYDSLHYAVTSKGWAKLDVGTKREIVGEIQSEATANAGTMLLGVYPEIAKVMIRKDVNPQLKKVFGKTQSEIDAAPLLDREINPAYESLKEKASPGSVSGPSGKLNQMADTKEPRKSISHMFGEVNFRDSIVEGNRALRSTKSFPAHTLIEQVKSEASTPESADLADKLSKVMAVQPKFNVSLVKATRGAFNVRGTSDLKDSNIDLFIPADGFSSLQGGSGKNYTREMLDGRNEETLLHETTHSVITNMVNAKGKGVREVVPEFEALWHDWTDYANKAYVDARKNKDSSANNAAENMDNLHEFIAYSLSNPATQELMRSTPFERIRAPLEYKTSEQKQIENVRAIKSLDRELNGTVWDKVVGTVADALGIGQQEPKKISFLDAVLDARNAAFDRAERMTVYKNSANSPYTSLTKGTKKDIIDTLGVDVVESKSPGFSYDPLTHTLTKGPGVSDEDIASMVKGKDSKWKQQSVKVKLEDGEMVDVPADKVAKLMRMKVGAARKLLEEYNAPD